jgi:cytoplasmic tRNA 2-thiolation protein 2
MPAAAAPDSPAVCKRCNAVPSTHILRGTPHCSECFSYYIRSKCVKRMESYKIRATPKSKGMPTPSAPGTSDGIPTFLLPISFGISSVSLLHLLDSQLAIQRSKVSRSRYHLKILHIDEQILSSAHPNGTASLAAVKERYPDAGEFLPVAPLSEACPDLRKTLSALPSATSREDMAGVLRARLIVAIAQREGCVGILWGDTTTRLADKVMASAAKGRGAQLPFAIGDGVVPPGELMHYHPLRDVFKKELATFVTEITSPPLTELCTAWSPTPKHSAAAATSARNITVGELLTQYFENMELQYPSTVSNVLRMGDRLKFAGGDEMCRMCGLPVEAGGSGLTLGEEEEEVEEQRKLCYGCMRATHDASEELSWPEL